MPVMRMSPAVAGMPTTRILSERRSASPPSIRASSATRAVTKKYSACGYGWYVPKLAHFAT